MELRVCTTGCVTWSFAVTEVQVIRPESPLVKESEVQMVLSSLLSLVYA